MYRVYVRESISSHPYRFSAEFPLREDAAEFIRLASDELPQASFSMRPVRYPTPSESLSNLLERRNVHVKGILSSGLQESQYQELYDRLTQEIQHTNREE